MASKTLRRFRDEVVKIKRGRLVTFRNISQHENVTRTVFGVDEEKKLIKKLMDIETVSHSLTSPRTREISIASPREGEII